LIAISIGLGAGYFVSPGTGADVTVTSTAEAPAETEGVNQTFLNIIIMNAIESLTNGDILQIIIYAILNGIGITIVDDTVKQVKQFFDGLAVIMYKITCLIMVLVPIGIFGLLAPIIGAHGLSVLLPLLKLIFAMFVACLIHAGLVYSSAVKTFGQI